MRPVLSNAYAGSLLVRGEVEGVEERLRDAERWLDATDEAADRSAGRAGSMVVVDEAAFRRLPGSVAVHRAGQALILGDVAGAAAHARRVLDLVGDDDHVERGGAAALLALAHWTTGDLEAAGRRYVTGMASLEKAGHLSDVIGCALALADIRLAQGRLGEAMRTFERGLALATGQGGKVLRGAADMHVGISTILRERDDLEGARRHLSEAEALGEGNGLPQNRYRSRVALAAIRHAEGDLDGALELLTEAEQLLRRRLLPRCAPGRRREGKGADRPGEAVGGVGLGAGAWCHDADELSYLHEFEHATLARLLLAQGTHDRSDRPHPGGNGAPGAPAGRRGGR